MVLDYTYKTEENVTGHTRLYQFNVKKKEYRRPTLVCLYEGQTGLLGFGSSPKNRMKRSNRSKKGRRTYILR